MLVGVAGIALAQSAFSLLGQAAAKKDYKRFWVYIRKGTIYNLLITVPGAIFLAIFAFIPAWMLQLSPSVRGIFVSLLAVYAISIPFESITHLLLRAFYSLKNTGVPAFTSVVSALAAIIAGYTLVPTLGVYALAIGYCVGQIVQLVLLAVILPRAARAT